MRSIGIPQSFAFSRHSDVEPEPLPTFVPTPVPTPTPTPMRQPARHVAPSPVSRRPFASVARPVPTEKPASADTAALLANIAELANEGKSADARAACERYLRNHEPVAQVFYWLGLLSDVGGNVLEAQGFYRKALYLEPQHPDALMHLAALLQSQGDTAGARRLQDRAARSERAADSERKR
jgi:chemotaxis protein methyltransferase WspC